MILHYFNKKETEDKKISELIYNKIINNVNLIISSNSEVLKKDINTKFEITSIFSYLYFFWIKIKKK